MPGSDPDHQGHLGDLKAKPTTELKDILMRQETLLKKTRFLRSLPDGGQKVRQFVKTLQELIAERTRHEVHRTTRESLPMEFDINHESSDGRVSCEPVNETTLELLQHNRVITQDICGSSRESGDELARDIQTLSMGDDTGESVSQSVSACVTEPKEPWATNSYQKAMVKCDKTHHSAGEKFKPNRTLKSKMAEVNMVEYQAEKKVGKEFDPTSLCVQVPPNITNKPVGKLTDISEDSSAGCPKYQYDCTKVISLEESFQLQQEQARKEANVRAQYAAERLTGKLHMKMDHFKLEGEMFKSYRSPEEDVDSLDSDDNDYPE